MVLSLDAKRKLLNEIHGELDSESDLPRVLREKGISHKEYQRYLHTISEADEAEYTKAKPAETFNLDLIVSKLDMKELNAMATTYCISKESAGQILLHDAIRLLLRPGGQMRYDMVIREDS